MTPFSQASQNTTNVAVTGTAQSLAVTSLGSAQQIVLTNIGTQTVFVRCDGVTATTGNAMPILANSQVVITVASNVTALSVIAAATGSTLYATSGSGE